MCIVTSSLRPSLWTRSHCESHAVLTIFSSNYDFSSFNSYGFGSIQSFYVMLTSLVFMQWRWNLKSFSLVWQMLIGFLRVCVYLIFLVLIKNDKRRSIWSNPWGARPKHGHLSYCMNTTHSNNITIGVQH